MRYRSWDMAYGMWVMGFGSYWMEQQQHPEPVDSGSEDPTPAETSPSAMG